MGMPWPQTATTQYHAHLGLPDKDHTIISLVFCNNWDLEPLDLLNDLVLGGYQPSPEVLIVLKLIFQTSLVLLDVIVIL